MPCSRMRVRPMSSESPSPTRTAPKISWPSSPGTAPFGCSSRMLPPISRISSTSDTSDRDKFLRGRCTCGHVCRDRLKSYRRATAHLLRRADDTARPNACELARRLSPELCRQRLRQPDQARLGRRIGLTHGDVHLDGHDMLSHAVKNLGAPDPRVLACIGELADTRHGFESFSGLLALRIDCGKGERIDLNDVI